MSKWSSGLKLSIWDILSIAVLVATFIVFIVVLIIFINPDSSINPFPYPTLPSTMEVPSSTPTLFSLPATWTPTPKNEATAEIIYVTATP